MGSFTHWGKSPQYLLLRVWVELTSVQETLGRKETLWHYLESKDDFPVV